MFVWDVQKQPAGVGIATQDVMVTKSSKPKTRKRRALSKGKILIISRYEKKCFKQEQEGKKMIDIGENIREIRKLKGMTQKELGNKLGISQSAINQFENNKTAPKLQTIEKLAIALEVSMYDILKRGAEYYQPTGVNLDINIIKNALHSHEAIAETPLDKVTVTALKELLEYKETGLTPQDIKDMDKMYLEKCQQVNKLTCTCEMYERMAKK